MGTKLLDALPGGRRSTTNRRQDPGGGPYEEEVFAMFSRVAIVVFCLELLAGPVLSADMPIRHPYSIHHPGTRAVVAYFRAVQFCEQQAEPATLHCAPRTLVPEDQLTAGSGGQFLDLSKVSRRPYAQMFIWSR